MRNMAAVVLAVAVAPGVYGATKTVEVRDFIFVPGEVTIQEGDTIQWVWLEGHHTATSDAEVGGVPVFHSGYRFAGDPAFSYTFNSTGSHRYYCQPHGGKNGIGMAGIVHVTEKPDPPPAPTALTATAVSASAVALSWSASSQADEYEVHRATSRTGAYTEVLTSTDTTDMDTGLMAGRTYLYKVRAVGDGGSSPFSNVDPATTVVFTDAVLAGMGVRALHVAELRAAVNAYRAAAALGPMPFTDDPLSEGTPIRADHISELRDALDDARALLGMAALMYADDPLLQATTLIKAIHAEQLRLGVR